MNLSRLFSSHFSSLLEPSHRVLVAVSGGLDSVVLLDLLAKYGLNDLAVVHCNFHLRGEASDGDEQFVRQLAESYGLPFFCAHFDTYAEQKKSKESIQMIARNLRYSYFLELLKKEKFDCIAVAHHADDQVETFFINLLRGAGVKGLRGMLPKREHIIRPLLNFSRQDLKDYAEENHLKHREDASNSSDDYLRNAIRHHLIPCLESLDKSAKKSILKSIENLQDLENQSLQSLETLQNCGFSATQIRNIQKTVEHSSGKKFISKTHRAITHNGQLEIEPTSIEAENAGFRIDLIPIEEFQLSKDPNVAQLDFDKLRFPLTLRHWQEGDYFVPFGQRGKQKLSNFFINQKFSLFDKEKVWLLCSGENVVWIVGHRIDNRYRVSEDTRRVLLVNNVQFDD